MRNYALIFMGGVIGIAIGVAASFIWREGDRYLHAGFGLCELNDLNRVKSLMADGFDINEPFVSKNGSIGLWILSSMTNVKCDFEDSGNFEQFVIFYFDNGGLAGLETIKWLQDVAVEKDMKELSGKLQLVQIQN